MGDNIYRDVDLLNFSAENELQKTGKKIENFLCFFRKSRFGFVLPWKSLPSRKNAMVLEKEWIYRGFQLSANIRRKLSLILREIAKTRAIFQLHANRTVFKDLWNTLPWREHVEILKRFKMSLGSIS